MSERRKNKFYRLSVKYLVHTATQSVKLDATGCPLKLKLGPRATLLRVFRKSEILDRLTAKKPTDLTYFNVKSFLFLFLAYICVSLYANLCLKITDTPWQYSFLWCKRAILVG